MSIVEGLDGSPVRVVIYEDLQCPDCAAFRRMMDEHLLPRYSAKVAFVHRDFPLAKHEWAREAAIAARYFAGQNVKTGVEFLRYIFENQSGITEANFKEKLGEFAARHRVEAAKAVSALNDRAPADLVETDYHDGVAGGVSKAPTVLVNGTPFVETFTAEEISKAIDQALAESR